MFQFLGSLAVEGYVGFWCPKTYSLPCLSPHYPLWNWKFFFCLHTNKS